MRLPGREKQCIFWTVVWRPFSKVLFFCLYVTNRGLLDLGYLPVRRKNHHRIWTAAHRQTGSPYEGSFPGRHKRRLAHEGTPEVDTRSRTQDTGSGGVVGRQNRINGTNSSAAQSPLSHFPAITRRLENHKTIIIISDTPGWGPFPLLPHHLKDRS